MRMLVVKDWMARKIKEEKKLSGNTFHTDVFGILKETEKAYQVMIGWGTRRAVTAWVPKSATEWQDTEIASKETRYFETYEEAIEEFHAEMKFFN